MAIERAGDAASIAVASRDALKVTVSRWENDHQVPSDDYCDLLCRVFQVQPEDIGLTGRVTSLSVVPAAGRRITPEVFSYFETVLSQYVQADQILGPWHVRGVAAEQVKQLEALCVSAADPARAKLQRLAARYCEFLGWLSQDSGDLIDAERWTARAGEHAQLAGDTFSSATSPCAEPGS